ncbi:MFS transporter [Chitinasiproducens palmae]|uniref:MFS transporter n=1 Tax=Chitinasiproducens palmae TaxID=1770053 RepID=UPI00147FC212|nr:MFS transporter [Chitinasiproducens palmae]
MAGPLRAGVSAAAPERPDTRPHAAAEATRGVGATCGAALWLVVCALASAMLLSSAPSALYPLYQQRWQMSSVALTGAFTAYGIAVLVTLLGCAPLADRLRDRRWFIVPGLAMVAGGALALAFGDAPVWLFAGRALAGLGAGVLTGSCNAALFELLPREAHGRAAALATLSLTCGGALGPILAGIALRFDLWPLLTPYLVVALIALGTAAGLYAVHWPARVPVAHSTTQRSRRLGESIRHPDFITASATLMFSWAIASVIQALGPLIASDYAGIASRSAAGLTVTGFQLAAGLAQLTLRGRAPDRLALRGAILLGVALAAAVLATWAVWPLLYAGALVVAGASYGAAFVGAAGLVNRAAPPDKRGAMVSLFYLLGYVGNAIPVLAIGVGADAFGMRAAMTTFACAMLGAAALLYRYTVYGALGRAR